MYVEATLDSLVACLPGLDLRGGIFSPARHISPTNLRVDKHILWLVLANEPSFNGICGVFLAPELFGWRAEFRWSASAGREV